MFPSHSVYIHNNKKKCSYFCTTYMYDLKSQVYIKFPYNKQNIKNNHF
jgi:hypothetical protein